MRKILGLDLGTNSIGWAVVNEAESCVCNCKDTNLKAIHNFAPNLILIAQSVNCATDNKRPL